MDTSTQNKAKTLRPWVKGQSGNPGGRPKSDPEVVEILKAATPAAAEFLVNLMMDEKTPARIRLQAAEAIMDRVYGRPTQPIDATIGGTGVPVTISFEGALEKWSQ